MSRAATQGFSSISSTVLMVSLASRTVSALGSDFGCFGRADGVERFGREDAVAFEDSRRSS